MTMSGTHTEAVLNKLIKPELVQLLLKLLWAHKLLICQRKLKTLFTHIKKLEAHIAVVRTVDDRLVERVVKTERH